MTTAPTYETGIGIYGISKGNPGPGAYKAVIRNTRTGAERSVEGRAPSTTANRMELTAALQGLEAVLPGGSVMVSRTASTWRRG